MNIDDRGRRAANEIRNARREARFTVKSPAQGGSPSWWPLVTAAVVAVIALVGLVQLLGSDRGTVTDTTTPVETTAPATTVPPTTVAPSTTAAPSTTTEAPTTTAPTSTTTPTTTVPIPERAIAQAMGTGLVWVDPTTGETEVANDIVFEASGASRLALSPDGSRVYYHLNFEDSWFSCESVGGEVTIMDIASGETTTVADGQPALSPDGQRLAYLGSDGEGCLPDPQEPQFFVPAYDTLVITDDNGNGLLRFPVDGEVGSPEASLQNVVWLDNDTVLVTDGTGTHYRIPVDVSAGRPIGEHETMNLPEIDLFAVVGDRGIGADFDAATGYGPLQIVDLTTGALSPIQGEPYGEVGVSSDGAVIISSHTPSAQLLIDVDLATGVPAQVVDLPEYFNAIDW